MLKINKHIEVVRSTKSGLSSMSQRSCEALVAVLARHYAQVGVTIVNTAADLANVAARQPDLVFLGMKFVPQAETPARQDSPKLWVADYLDACGIAYTGSDQSAHELELNKPLAKQRAVEAGLRTAPFYVIKQNQPTDATSPTMPFPLFVKPTNRGGGLGVDSQSVVHTAAALDAKVHSIATRLQADALVETYLPGREFSVAILQDAYSTRLRAMPIELVAPLNDNGVRLLSGRDKSRNSEQALAVTDARIHSQVATLAVQVFEALGARDYGRIDIRLDEAGAAHFLEANLIPSLIAGYGSFPKACVLNRALGYEAMILHIVNLALQRTSDRGAYQAAQPLIEEAAPLSAGI